MVCNVEENKLFNISLENNRLHLNRRILLGGWTVPPFVVKDCVIFVPMSFHYVLNVIPVQAKFNV